MPAVASPASPRRCCSRRQGHAVTLYERFDAPRPLGSGLMLQPTGLAVLAELGLAAEVAACSAPIVRIHGRNTLGETVLDARYADLGVPGACGLGIHRASLFGVLYDAVLAEGGSRSAPAARSRAASSRATAGACCSRRPIPRRRTISWSTRSASPRRWPARTRGGCRSARCGPRLPGRADGPFRPDWLEQRYERAQPDGGRAADRTAARLGPQRAGAVLVAARRRASSAGASAGSTRGRTSSSRCGPSARTCSSQIDDPAALTFARYAHRTQRRPVAPRLIHIGDAWHSASPQLGQGANMALLDAWALAQALGGDGALDARLADAVALRRSHVRLYQWLTALFTPAYQSDSPWPALIRDLLLAPLSRVPPGPRVQADMVSGLTGGPLGSARAGHARLRGVQLSAIVAVPR